MERGKLIALYGINGIGKTTQTERLVDVLRSHGLRAERLKYPIYDLPPEGPFIHRYLREPDFREANPRTTEELQEAYAENRRRYEPTLRKRLDAGEWIVAEDYVGTGIAWGLSWGADLDRLERMNADLYPADLSVLMHGNRFNTAIEKDHRNEMEAERIAISRNFHFLLGERYGWERVDANRSVEAVSKDIRSVVSGRFGL